jgi:hypothetical protein
VTARPAEHRPLRARATLRLAAGMALAVAVLAILAMALQYRLVSDRLDQAQRTLLASDMDGLAALYEQRRIIALRPSIPRRKSPWATAAFWSRRANCPGTFRSWSAVRSRRWMRPLPPCARAWPG